MKLAEKQAFKIVEKILNWLGIEIKIKEDDSVTGIQVTEKEISDFVMLELINLEL